MLVYIRLTQSSAQISWGWSVWELSAADEGRASFFFDLFLKQAALENLNQRRDFLPWLSILPSERSCSTHTFAWERRIDESVKGINKDLLPSVRQRWELNRQVCCQ